MNLYYKAVAAQFFGEPETDYAWTIDTDHLYEDETDRNAVGVTGPSDAPADLLAKLGAGEGYVFKIYDDDNELYYTGRLVFYPEEDGHPSNEAVAGPLDDYGTPNDGATEVRYPGKPMWNCP